MIAYRALTRDELDRVWEIDRNELIVAHYRTRGAGLERVERTERVDGWPAAQIEKDAPRLAACFDAGGSLLGAWSGQALLGVVSVEPAWLGPKRDWLLLSYLYVDRSARGRGVGRELFVRAAEWAKARGARALYVSATPTVATVDFYRACGAAPLEEPDPALFALEPEDIHMLVTL